MSRAMRNLNPGNIRLSATRFKGEVVPSRDSAFKQFESLEYGYRAMFVLLDTYARRYGLSSIRQRIDSRSPRDMVPIVAAMAEIESGESPSIEDIHRGWNLFARDRDAVAVE